jgi:hypothetical protein
MSYALQKAIYDYLNPKARAGAPPLDADSLRARYGLTEPEVRAVLAALEAEAAGDAGRG